MSKNNIFKKTKIRRIRGLQILDASNTWLISVK
jgi:hypothetical protein